MYSIVIEDMYVVPKPGSRQVATFYCTLMISVQN
jgi:hypothetical protein